MNPEDAILDEIIAVLEDILQSGEEISDDLITLLSDLVSPEGTPEAPIEAPIPRGADLIWILSGENPQVFTEYLRTFPDPELNSLLNNPTRLAETIARLQRQITLPAGQSEEGVPQAGLQSSNIYGFKYDPRNKRLWVRFQGDGVYEYEGVPPQVFKIFQAGAIPAKTNGRNEYGAWWVGKSPSLGASFYTLIRQGGYPYQKVS